MFKKWQQNDDQDITTDNVIDNNGENPVEEINTPKADRTANTILKGSKLIGNINITCDLELSGEIEGNITSDQNSNIVIKGTCKGDIETREGSVDIEGGMEGGNISAGSDVNISGKFKGGEVKAKGRISINGKFDGKMEGNEIEIGSDSQCKGELYYREYISISRGANIEGQISRIPSELKLVKKLPDIHEADMKPPAQEISGA
jgi:cytoskeletal protein CcmA (bactofilin family)